MCRAAKSRTSGAVFGLLGSLCLRSTVPPVNATLRHSFCTKKAPPKRCLIVVEKCGIPLRDFLAAAPRKLRICHFPSTPFLPTIKQMLARTRENSRSRAARYLRHEKSTAKAVPYRGGDNEIRTRGLYVANVPLYQLSHIPVGCTMIIAYRLKKASVFNRFS